MTQPASKQYSLVNKRKSILWTVYFAYIYLLAIGGLIFLEQVSIHFLTGYLSLSLLTVLFYGWDKRAAQKGNRRIPEITLQALALIGGWPGAIWAQQKFRHKSKKLSFRMQLWLMIIFNISAFVWFFVPQTAEFIESVL